jgi:hypothetical protein
MMALCTALQQNGAWFSGYSIWFNGSQRAGRFKDRCNPKSPYFVSSAPLTVEPGGKPQSPSWGWIKPLINGDSRVSADERRKFELVAASPSAKSGRVVRCACDVGILEGGRTVN